MVAARLTSAWHGHCPAHLGMAWSLPGSPWHGMVTARLTLAWHGHCQAHLGMARQRHSSFKIYYLAQTAFIASVPGSF